MKEKIQNDLKEAMKTKDELRTSVLRMLSSAIHNREIEKKTKSGESELTEEEIIAVIRSEIKKRRDAAEGFTKGGRDDTAEQELAEQKILETYLPAELSDEEIEKAVKEVIAGMGEVTMKPFDKAQGREFGKIMGETMKRLKGRAGGERVKAMLEQIMQK